MPTPPTPPARMRTAQKVELAERVSAALKAEGIDVPTLRAFYLVDVFEELGIIAAPAVEVAE